LKVVEWKKREMGEIISNMEIEKKKKTTLFFPQSPYSVIAIASVMLLG